MLPPDLLDAYPARFWAVEPPRPLGNAGGLSGASLWRFQADAGELVLRAWPVDGPGLTEVETVHGCLAMAGRLGFIPVPIRRLDGRTASHREGRIWELAPWMPGEPDLSKPPPEARLRSIFAGLASFHAAFAGRLRAGESPGLASRVGEIEALIGGGFDRIADHLDRTRPDLLVDLARSWLDRARVLAPRILGPTRRAASIELPLQPCLRDARPDHFLLVEDRLTGLVDFGAMGVDSVAADLGRLIGEGVGADFLARSTAITAYESVRRLEPRELAAIGAFERANALLGGARWVRWHFIERRAFDDPNAIRRGLAAGLDRIRALLPT